MAGAAGFVAAPVFVAGGGFCAAGIPAGGGGGGGGAAGRFCANEVSAMQVMQSVSSVFIFAAEVE